MNTPGNIIQQFGLDTSTILDDFLIAADCALENGLETFAHFLRTQAHELVERQIAYHDNTGYCLWQKDGAYAGPRNSYGRGYSQDDEYGFGMGVGISYGDSVYDEDNERFWPDGAGYGFGHFPIKGGGYGLGLADGAGQSVDSKTRYRSFGGYGDGTLDGAGQGHGANSSVDFLPNRWGAGYGSALDDGSGQGGDPYDFETPSSGPSCHDA